MAVHAIVLAGGAGTRFWPASRALRPKQLLPLVSDHESLLAGTVSRIAPLVSPDRVVIATGAHLLDATRAAVPQVPAENFLAEPAARNTAPAIAWATAEIARRDPDALCMVLPSDHFIAKPDAFVACVEQALDGARRGWLTTLGIRPTRADTGFGYIEIGATISGVGAGALHEAARFVEKPTSEIAQGYVASGKFLWNAGMFFYAAKTMLDALREHLPDVARIASSPNVASEFASMPSISIDHGVMEKAKRVAVVPGEFGWSDLGSWQSAWELATKDADENAMPEGSVAIDARGNLVWDRSSKKRTFALVGVRDLVIVETDDAVLVVPRERAQDVKLVVEKLRASGSNKI